MREMDRWIAWIVAKVSVAILAGAGIAGSAAAVLLPVATASNLLPPTYACFGAAPCSQGEQAILALLGLVGTVVSAGLALTVAGKAGVDELLRVGRGNRLQFDYGYEAVYRV